MQQPRKPTIVYELDEDDCSEPESRVRVKAEPTFDRLMEQICADCDAGLITPDEAMEKVIAANGEHLGHVLLPGQREQLEDYLRQMADTPLLRKLMGRDK